MSRDDDDDDDFVEEPWQQLNDDADRMRVPGGWIYLISRSEEHVVFVPDPPRPARAGAPS